MSIYDELLARGFIKQCSHEKDLRETLGTSKVVYYVGFDPTAPSLQVGNLVPIMAMAHLQRAGHVPIVIIGGGTAMIGDPSGKTESRRMMSREEIEANGKRLLEQMRRFLLLDEKGGLTLDNADWILNLPLITFLRDTGTRFRVNDMLRAEGYRQRLEREEGLSFLEFSYQLLQALDFQVLFERHGCTLQMGGDDQWGNILAGVDLIRRVHGRQEVKEGEPQKSLSFGLTFPLLVTARGHKMGKTEKGTVWLDAERTSPYEFYQYWVNLPDSDVFRFLRIFTFLSLEEIEKLEQLEGADIRGAKRTLAFEVTKLVHGKDAARKAQDVSLATFGGGEAGEADLPTTRIAHDRLENGIPVAELFVEVGLVSTKSEVRRLIRQRGIYVDDVPIESENAMVRTDMNCAVVLRRGKKHYHRIIPA